MLQKTTNAKQSNENATFEEKIKLAYAEYELEKRTNSDADIETITKNSLEKTFNESITTEKVGNSLKITFNERNKKYKYLANGKIIELLNPTDIYWKLDNEGTLHMRATQAEGYIKDNSFTYRNSASNIKKVILEEKISPSSVNYMFSNCINLEELKQIENLHTENTSSMTFMFHNCNSLKELDVSNFDTSQVTNMSSMFLACNSLIEIDLSQFNTTQVTTMAQMFQGCTSLEKINLNGLVTSNVEIIGSMFSGCKKVKELNLSSFDTNKVTNMNWTFNGCSSLKKLDISNFIINNGIEFNYMFTAVPQDIEIIALQDAKNKIIEKYPDLEDNF